MQASLVNRWVYDQLPNPVLALLVRRFAGHPELHALVRSWYHPRLLHRLLWPLLAPRLRTNSAVAARVQR